MTINEEIAEVRNLLVEASEEITGKVDELNAKIDELAAQVAASEPVDPALLAEVKALAVSLADVVPNTVEAVDEVVAEAEEPAAEPTE